MPTIEEMKTVFAGLTCTETDQKLPWSQMSEALLRCGFNIKICELEYLSLKQDRLSFVDFHRVVATGVARRKEMKKTYAGKRLQTFDEWKDSYLQQRLAPGDRAAWIREHPRHGVVPADRTCPSDVIGFDKYMDHFLENADPFTHYNAIVYDELTPLMLCCQYGLLDKIKLLLNNPMVDLNAKSLVKGETALHWGVISGNVEVIKILGSRTDLVWNAGDKEGRPAHFLALMDGNMEVLQLLVSSHHAAIDWNIKIDGFPIIFTNFYWRTEAILKSVDHRVTPEQRMAIFNLLLEIPSLDWNAKNTRGETLLGLALDKQDVKMVLFLFEAPGLDYDVDQLSDMIISQSTIRKCLTVLEERQMTHVYSNAVNFLNAAKKFALDIRHMQFMY